MKLKGLSTGIVQSIKSFWNPFEVEFKSFTTEIRRLNGEVEKEIHLAAAQAAENDQRLQAHERQAADSHRKLGASHFRKFLQLSTDDQEWKVKVQERESSKSVIFRITNQSDLIS